MVLKYVLCMIFFVAVNGMPSNKNKFDIPSDVQALIDGLHEICFEKIGITHDDVENYQISNNSPNMMCYMRCMMLESKWMNPDGSIQYDFIADRSPAVVKPYLIPALEKCKDIAAGTHECEKAYNFNVCLQNFDPDHYFLP